MCFCYIIQLWLQRQATDSAICVIALLGFAIQIDTPVNMKEGDNQRNQGESEPRLRKAFHSMRDDAMFSEGWLKLIVPRTPPSGLMLSSSSTTPSLESGRRNRMSSFARTELTTVVELPHISLMSCSVFALSGSDLLSRICRTLR